MRLCGFAKGVLDRPDASRSLENLAQEQACLQQSGPNGRVGTELSSARKATANSWRIGNSSMDRAAGYINMPSEAHPTPVRAPEGPHRGAPHQGAVTLGVAGRGIVSARSALLCILLHTYT